MSADSAPPPPPSSRTRSRTFTPRKALGWLASLVKLVCGLIALLLVVYIAFTLGKANPANAWAIFVSTWAQKFDLGLANLFAPPSPPWLAVVLNYGIPALIWLVIGSLLSRLIRRF
ncbi:MAG TPA: hypothetical protein VGH72_21850 [Pseudonocardia sp.]|uniref:hypothetical protein n=1 Tax=Pseudonocardia sp. Cha107L01 TaxID=3457576 RepID=UPI002F43D52E